jgi:hypothetical protein
LESRFNEARKQVKTDETSEVQSSQKKEMGEVI